MYTASITTAEYVFLFLIVLPFLPLPSGHVSPEAGFRRATSVNVQLLRLRSSKGKFIMFREIEPVRRSFRRRRSCTFTEVALWLPWGGLSSLQANGSPGEQR